MSLDDESEVIISADPGGVGHVTLNRPSSMNALSHHMVLRIAGALQSWRDDSSIRTVVIDGAGSRGLCAGGDIRSIYDDIPRGGDACRLFWADEYRLNATIARYRKPIVVFMDGVVMGGGVGIAVHASHRVVSERSAISMPEVSIGFTPDVGGTYRLARAPGEIGTHLGLTADQMNAGDAIYCGFADMYIPTEQRGRVLHSLRSLSVDEALSSVSAEPPEGKLVRSQSWIDACYSVDSIEEILARLRQIDHAEAAKAADRLESYSPTAAKVTLRALREASQETSLEQSLAREFRASLRSVAGPDFREGIRAQIIDKDRQPHWQPGTLADVTDQDVDRYFDSLGPLELEFGSDLEDGTRLHDG